MNAEARMARDPRAEARSAVGPVAYMMSRFPEITETFVLFEMMAVEELGRRVEVYPLVRQRQSVVHPECEPYIDRAHFHPFLSVSVLASNLRFLVTTPGRYLGALTTLLLATVGSPRYFTRAVALFPKAVHFAGEMREQGVGHIHAHFSSHPAAAAFVIGRLTDIPFSFTAHGSDLHRDRHMLLEKVREAAFVVTISEYNKEVIVTECGEQYRDKIHIVRCGVDTSVFRPRYRERKADAPFRIACVGTLHEVKGQTHLIEAVRILRDAGVEVECHLVGDGPDRAMLAEQAVRSGLAGQIVFHGECTRSQVAELLGTADALALASVPTRSGRREGIPVVLMEAMASGLPVVASRISGIPELVEDGVSGLLTPPADPGALAAALRSLSERPELARQLGMGGRAKVESEFDVRKNAARLLQFFDGEGLP